MDEIVVKDLCFSYDNEHETLSHVSFSICKGSYVSIVGHNGSGKSTLAKLLIGLIERNSGDIFIADIPLSNETIKDVRSKMCLVFQNPDNQFIGSTVEDDIAFGLENKCVPHDEMQSIIDTFAQEVGMSKFLHKEPSMLSGGQKQRVAIAGALALSPEIIIFDESTSMLDPKGKKEIGDLILKMRQNKPDLTVISITHDIEEAFLSDEVIVLSEGKIVLSGKPETVFANRDMLQKYCLDMPFILSFKKQLDGIGINISTNDDLNKIAELICQSK